MYIAGHLLSSTILAGFTYKKLKLPFVPLATAMMLINLIDIDHLFFFRLDNGSANSFDLHPLHQFWAFVGLTFCLLALILKPYQNMIFGMLFALVLHYLTDTFAHYINYDYVTLIGLDFIMILGLIAMFRFKVIEDPQSKSIILFLLLSMLASTGIQAIEVLVLHMQPNETIWVYLTASLLTLIIPILFYQLFKPSRS